MLDLLPLEHRHKSSQTRSQNKLLNQHFCTRAKTKRRTTALKHGKRRPQVEQDRKKKMKRQRNTAQMKEQGGDSLYQINGEEISNQPEREFRRMIVKML